MKLDFSQQLRNLDGSPMVESAPGSDVSVKVTLGIVAANALLAPDDPSAKQSGDDKARAYSLATRVYGASELDITVDDASFIKKRVGQSMPTIVVGQVYELIDGKTPIGA